MNALFLLTGLLAGCGVWLLLTAKLLHDTSYSGRRTLGKFRKGQLQRKDPWSGPLLRRLTAFFARFVWPDPEEESRLNRRLERAELPVNAREYTARRYVLFAGGALLAGACALLRFWLGILFAVLLTAFAVMKQREQLSSRLQAKDAAVADEMPRFIRTVCRNLRSNRDIFAAMQSYRKVAGEELGSEIDILLAHMRTGGTAEALRQFQRRLGTEEAFRLCSALTEIDRGIDQTAALDYLADDMARQSRYRIQQTLEKRPGKMRLTYLPAVGICVVLILYVLIVFVEKQLSGL